MRTAGIDLSQEHLDVHLPQAGYVRLSNTHDGLLELLELIESERVEVVVMEASGGLESPIAYGLSTSALRIYVVNPRRTRQFAEAVGRLEKTDKVDAKMLSHFGPIAVEHCPEWKPQPAVIQQLRAVVVRRRQLSCMRADELRRRRSAGKDLHPSYAAVVECLSTQLEKLDEEIEALLRHAELKSKANRLRSVPGVGPVLAASLIALLPELGQLSSKKAAKLVGVAPIAHDSGKSSKRRVTRGGRAEVRQVLYMAALSAGRSNPTIREFKHRLVQSGKHKKVANVACMNKMIRLLNAMERDQIDWQQTQAAAA